MRQKLTGASVAVPANATRAALIAVRKQICNDIFY